MKIKNLFFIMTLLSIQRICCANSTLENRMQEQQEYCEAVTQGSEKRANRVQKVVNMLRTTWGITKVISAGIGLVGLANVVLAQKIFKFAGKETFMNIIVVIALIAAVESSVDSYANLKNDAHDLKEKIFCILEKKLGDKTEGSQ